MDSTTLERKSSSDIHINQCYLCNEDISSLVPGDTSVGNACYNICSNCSIFIIFIVFLKNI